MNIEGAVAVVAEDDPDVRELLVEQLRVWGYQVHAAENGRDALELVRRVNPDVALLDVRMPLMDGIAVAKALKQDPATEAIPTIIVTANGSGGPASAAIAAGAYDYVSKPFHIGELRERVRSATERSRRLRALQPLEEAIAQHDWVPQTTGLQTAKLSLPAQSAVSGGDFMAVTSSVSGKVMAIIGDVEGHGVGAAGLAAFTRLALSNCASHTDDPDVVLSLVNHLLLERGESGGEQLLVTAACCVIDPATGEVAWALAGHPAPILTVPIDGEPGSAGPPLGVMGGTGFPGGRARLSPGDRLLLFSDGLLTPRRDGAGFETAELPRLLGDPGAGLDEVLAKVAQAHEAVVGAPRTDDVTMLVVQMGSPAIAAAGETGPARKPAGSILGASVAG